MGEPSVSTRGIRVPRIAISAGIAMFAVLAGTGVASAGWSTDTVGTTTSVASASTTMTVGGPGSLTVQYKFAGTASPTVIKPITVANTGTTPLSYLLTVTGVAGNPLAPLVSLTLWKSTTTTCAATAPTTGATSGTFASPPSLPAGATTATAGTSFTLCAATRLTTTIVAAQGMSITPTIEISGYVGNWSTSDPDDTFTQSVYRMPTVVSVTCAQGVTNPGNPSIVVSWTAPASTGTTGTITYRIVDAAGAVIDGPLSNLSSTLKYNTLPEGVSILYVQALETQYGTVSAGVPFTVIRTTTGSTRTLACA